MAGVSFGLRPSFDQGLPALSADTQPSHREGQESGTNGASQGRRHMTEKQSARCSGEGERTEKSTSLGREHEGGKESPPRPLPAHRGTAEAGGASYMGNVCLIPRLRCSHAVDCPILLAFLDTSAAHVFHPREIQIFTLSCTSVSFFYG